MLKEDFINKNPLRIISPLGRGDSSPKRMGLVMARAGMGKTAVLVQIALDSMFQGNNILHVSIGQKLDKATVWYDDMFRDIARIRDLENFKQIQEEIMPRRMILTFNVDSFTVAKLKERLEDLVEQNIFCPACVLIDGCDDSPSDAELLELRALMDNYGFDTWFSARNHRGDQRASETGVPAPYHNAEKFFDTVILLQPVKDGDRIAFNIIKDQKEVSKTDKNLHLDPSSLLITEN
ncbi:MAG: hypothetical protein ACQES8_03800 [Thermodesulfobacteriota bacterium]